MSHQHSSCNCWRGCLWNNVCRRCRCMAQDLCSTCTWVWDLYLHTDPLSQETAQSLSRHRYRTPPLRFPWRHGTVQGCGQSHGSWCECGQTYHKITGLIQSHLKKDRARAGIINIILYGTRLMSFFSEDNENTNYYAMLFKTMLNQ